jgi:hypothetical protein
MRTLAAQFVLAAVISPMLRLHVHLKPLSAEAF